MVHPWSQLCTNILPDRRRHCLGSHVCPLRNVGLLNLTHLIPFNSLSWADTAASTIGRLFGARSPRLPSRLPFFGFPLAPRKSLAGFIAAAVTGTLIAVGFWGWIAPLRSGTAGLGWAWNSSTSSAAFLSSGGATAAGGWLELGVVGVVTGLVSGVAEALGAFFVLS